MIRSKGKAELLALDASLRVKVYQVSETVVNFMLGEKRVDQLCYRAFRGTYIPIENAEPEWKRRYTSN